MNVPKAPLALDALFPERTLIAPLTTMDAARRIFTGAFRLDAVTGNYLTIAGKMPLICSRDVATSEILDFFRLSGLEPAENLYIYRDQEEAIGYAKQLIVRGWRAIYLYPPPPPLGSGQGLVVPLPLYFYLNGKANIDDLVNEEDLPPHVSVGLDNLETVKDVFRERAVFIKGCANVATGAGADVLYCPALDARAGFPEWLSARSGSLSGIRVELALDIDPSWCINVAIGDEESIYLGAAIQLFEKPARQEGSRIDPDKAPSEEAVRIALGIAEKGRRLGFRGIAGFDIGEDMSGKAFVFDLNFRFVSSTVQVLLHDWAVGRVKARVSESWNKFVVCPLSPALNRIREFAEKGIFVPLRLYEGTPLSGNRSLITGFIVADSAREKKIIDDRMKEALGSFLERENK